MFVDRQKELALLQSEYENDGFGFCVIYGRRRVGKTTLIHEFIKDKPSIYFLATLENEAILVEKFKNLVADFFNDELLRDLSLNSFEQVFRYIVSKNT